ncbi:hypothetical protein BDN71DRAFT_896196 [Pleurotus eryngii]|uniref:Uncharacterized protein n=1 Tax=Pleurotus eryngii TaxID=5323 RepID=A0A9P6D711_PLEER|nr:hypothetical protein BDN71DRAFT_896196 [Pleurotus eryngii]
MRPRPPVEVAQRTTTMIAASSAQHEGGSRIQSIATRTHQQSNVSARPRLHPRRSMPRSRSLSTDHAASSLHNTSSTVHDADPARCMSPNPIQPRGRRPHRGPIPSRRRREDAKTQRRRRDHREGIRSYLGIRGGRCLGGERWRVRLIYWRGSIGESACCEGVHLFVNWRVRRVGRRRRCR